MSMSLAQLWQIVADAKNDLHVVEQELAKLIDKEEKRQDELPVYENSLPVGTYLMSEEEHRQAPIGTRIAEKHLRSGEIMEPGRWEKIGPDRWRGPASECQMTYTDAAICEAGPNYVNVVVEQEPTKLAGEKEKQQGEQSIPAGTALLTHEDHEKAPIGTLISEKDIRNGKVASLVWKKVDLNRWCVARPGFYAPCTDATICDRGSYYVNVVVEQDKDKTPVYENSLPAGTVLATYEDHVKAPIGTLIREYDYDTGEIGTWSWRKVGPDKWTEYDPVGPTHFPLNTAGVTQVLSHIVNVVVDS